MNRQILQILILLLLFSRITSQQTDCRRSPSHNSTDDFWRCRCEYKSSGRLTGGGGGNDAVAVTCTGVNWTEVPTPLSAHLFGGGATRPSSTILSLALVDGSLTSIGQDAFKGENIQQLDLSNNEISSINVNAFRGLESKLILLRLKGNRLNRVPSPSLIYLRQLQQLHFEDNMIDSLSGGDTFTETQLSNLRYLHLDNNRVEVVASDSLSQLSLLQVLTLSVNRISRLEGQSLPSGIWFIDLKANSLDEIPYLALRDCWTALRHLDLQSNNISIIKPSPMLEFTSQPLIQSPSPLDGSTSTNSMTLLLGMNKIEELADGALSSFTNIAKLDLSHNQIHLINDGAFKGIRHLSEIDLSHNYVAHLPSSKLFNELAASLKSVNLQENELHSVPLALRSLTSLEHLNLNGNELKSLDNDVISHLKANLTELHLASNLLERIPSECLEEMFSLRVLDLSRNRISRIEKMAFGSFAEGSGTRSLARLNLAGNLIKEVVDPGAFLYMQSLAQLDLSSNKIKRLSRAAFERLEGLESLLLKGNDIREFPRNALSSLNKLKYLQLDQNRIVNLPNYAFQWLVHLERLSLARNRIATINAKNFHTTSALQLKALNLGHNRISAMHTAAFENLPNLEVLWLNNNQLTTLQTQIISSLKNLRQLSLSNNLINETQESAFDNLPRMETLSLSHNRLRTMKEGIFRRVPHLTQLDLSYNRIEAFDLDFLDESAHQLTHLNLAHNVIRKLDLGAAKHSLIKLDARHNQLEFVDDKMMRGFDRLQQLNLANNDLIDMDKGAFRKSHHLRHLILSGNNLKLLGRDSFTDQLQLEVLDLSHNVIKSIEAGVFGTNNVLELNLSWNNLSEVPIKAMASIGGSLSVLDLRSNSIRSLGPKDFVGLTNVTHLLLSANRIETLEDETFRELTRLKHLDLGGNPVTSWAPNTFQRISPQLTHLNLANTGLFSLPRLVSADLHLLNISYNNVYELQLQEVEALTKLNTLDISHNNLVDVKAAIFERLPELHHLNLSGNGIKILHTEHFKHMGEIETLILGEMNALVRIPEAHAFSSLRRLRRLKFTGFSAYLTNYNISSILSHLPPLRHLHFELPSGVKEIGPNLVANADLRLLRSLTIRGKYLEHIHPLTFAKLRGYRFELAVEGGRLKELPHTLLRSMKGISFLSLSLENNQIETLKLFGAEEEQGNRPPLLNNHGTVLESLSLRGNPILCDCRIEWLSKWIDYLSAGPEESVKARQLLAETLCHQQHHHHNGHKKSSSSPMASSKELNLLDIYDTTHWSGLMNGRSTLGRNIATMKCDADGRLISDEAIIGKAIGNIWIYAVVAISIIVMSGYM